MKVLQNLEPKAVFEYFEEISNIPRGSGNEKEISDYLLNFGKRLGLESIQDEALNIIIKKPGTKGYENAPTVIIQGHMDMVCEKNNGIEHDFEKDPLKLRIVDDYIYATDTTLGADNGIAVAYAMAILASDDIPHPPIEVLITTDEETGMSGAMAINKEHIDGKILINLDNEEEGYLLVSCAGGIRSNATIDVNYQAINDKKLIKINISGLKGGHSGMDIIKERGNSNKILGRILKGLLREVKFNLVSLNGGSKNNAIPREAEAVIAINVNDENIVVDIINNWNTIISNELRAQDPGLKIEASIYSNNEGKEFTDECTSKVVNLLYLYPNGINTKSTEIEGLVESSTNLGVLTTVDNKVIFDSAIRSSVPSLKEEIVLRSKTIVELLGGDFSTTSDYPAWEYNPNSKIREICQNVHKEMYGKEAEIVAIHAGVECGLFNEKLGNLDMISFGPNLYDVHTPDEHMSISSVRNCYEYLKAILKEIK
ncbi:aminoacyl-histidine dipeptidase [Clostridium celatum]|nr:aminoacyl-histidine dipeptidase [Clostridium celatum]MCE9654598.1 aminoacyl-histidine dipeptidase [Clostridium celatum]MDU2265158.1 aminoacyl-histidine dipeptidase [Clostridium celatum]MDU3722257.1 aminoacyl-histidine dipeptidase [Clostridium celatum]MDU6295077.1 aminoacyl-histidine dipeptidase [Clostridium celatum]MDY3359534.1 aminoacyl-histidine dipeptidase [Clostridium celatum]